MEKNHLQPGPKQGPILERTPNFNPEPLQLESLYFHPFHPACEPHLFFPLSLVRSLHPESPPQHPTRRRRRHPARRRRRSSPAAGRIPAMAGSAPLGDGLPAWGGASDGPSRTRPPPRLTGAPLPRGISGDGRPPRPAAPTSASKKRRSPFVAPTRLAGPPPGGVLPRQNLDAKVDPVGVRPRQVPDAALAPGAFLPRQLFQSLPPGPLLPAPLRHEAPYRSSVFTGAGRKAQTPSFSEPAQLPSHQVQKTSREAAATASDTRRAASTTSLQDDGDYFISSSMPLYDWSPTLIADNNMHVGATPPGSQFNLARCLVSYFCYQAT